MKKYRLLTCILALACGCVLSAVTVQAADADKAGAHVIVTRVANFGSDLSLILRVDGAEVARLVEDRNYDGYLSPGKHVLSAEVYPNAGVDPWQQTVTLAAGQTYSYTATWSGSDLVLVRNP